MRVNSAGDRLTPHLAITNTSRETTTKLASETAIAAKRSDRARRHVPRDCGPAALFASGDEIVEGLRHESIASVGHVRTRTGEYRFSSNVLHNNPDFGVFLRTGLR